MSMGGDAAIESMTFNLVKRLSVKIDENPNNPELIKTLKELGNWAIGELPAWPGWVYQYKDKFRE